MGFNTVLNIIVENYKKKKMINTIEMVSPRWSIEEFQKQIFFIRKAMIFLLYIHLFFMSIF